MRSIDNGDPGLINQQIFNELADKYGKTNVQIKALDSGKRFYTATLEEQERNFSAWSPED